MLLLACLGAALSGLGYAGDQGQGGGAAHYDLGPIGLSVYLLGTWLGLVL